MVNIIYGGIFGLIIIASFFIGYWNGKKMGKQEGVDSCAKTAAWMFNTYCCDECRARIQQRASFLAQYYE